MSISERKLRYLIKEALVVSEWDENHEVNAVAKNIIENNPLINSSNIDDYLTDEDLHMTDFGDYQVNTEKLRNAIESMLFYRENNNR